MFSEAVNRLMSAAACLVVASWSLYWSRRVSMVLVCPASRSTSARSCSAAVFAVAVAAFSFASACFSSSSRFAFSSLKWAAVSGCPHARQFAEGRSSRENPVVALVASEYV